ncbi:hypothetical protein, variant [Aphanomyces invadans]|uniref:MSP domain-containing protein n=1 Tax=Aphanomyces invadans TaxID=157072 RepID=A0A024U7M1_9STRA|nr:hypothetical protein, variant [Aphanomyces invadans]ETW02225.1 hypothetical protein, variant [Aphanomyces invadans]|eukprot:XP_008868830.1 hypothetical protein, variant [Aphanomyces invadans]
MPSRNKRRGGDKPSYSMDDNEAGSALQERSTTSPILHRSFPREKSPTSATGQPTVPSMPLASLVRPSLGIRVLPSSVVDAANLFSFGDIYLSDLSNLRQFEIVNLQSCPVRVDMKADIRKPFLATTWGFQTHNENLNLLPMDDCDLHENDPFTRSHSKSSIASSTTDTTYLDEGFNELFNQMGLIDSLVLQPNQAQRIIFSMCVKFDTMPSQTSMSSGLSSNRPTDDSSDDERLHLHETSLIALTGRLLFSTTVLDANNSGSGQAGALPTRAPSASLAESTTTIAVPLQGNVCRSLLRLDIKELHFDDCVPGGSYVKDFTVWNRSEIPLIFRLVTSSVTATEKQLLTCSDYNTGYALGESPFTVAAYSHMRIRVTFRPMEVGEQFFEILAQNMHNSRNVKTLKIHAIASKEHHREGLSIRDPNGSYLMGGGLLDFGDCYTGFPTSKVLVLKNMTEVALHIELLSDRPKEVTFELKLAHTNRHAMRSTRSRMGFGLDEPLSPSETDRRLSLSPPTSPAKSGSVGGQLSPSSVMPSSPTMGEGALDSDDEPDEPDGDFHDDESVMYTPRKRGSFDDQLLSEADDIDDDMVFDGDKGVPVPVVASPKDDGSIVKAIAMSTRIRTKQRSLRALSRMKDLVESGVESGASVCSSPERMSKKKIQSGSSRTLKGLSVASSTAEGDHVNNYLVEALDLPPGVERTVLVWYCPPLKAMDDALDMKCCRLTKQSFRLNFRCYTIDGGGAGWTGGGATQRMYDRSLGKSLNVGARTCTSYVTLSPSTLHLGDCNIGEFKSSSLTLTNHSELPTVVKPSVVSKVISTVPNDAITLGPKQSMELKIEIIPRKTNPNYSRIVSVVNLKNKANVATVCVRSSNMDAHHVIYHSLFYKLVTPSKSAFLNFEHVAANSMGMKVFMLENITHAPLRLRIQSSDLSRLQLYCVADATTKLSTTPTTLVSPPSMINLPPAGKDVRGKLPLRRRRSIGCVSELVPKPKPAMSSTRLVDILKRKGSKPLLVDELFAPLSSGQPAGAALSTSGPSTGATPVKREIEYVDGVIVPSDMHEVLGLFETNWRWDHEDEVVTMVRERVRRFHALVQEKQIVPISTATEWNLRIPPKRSFPILAVFTPKIGDVVEDKTRVEKFKVYITLPAGGNKPIGKLNHDAYVHHPFDTRPSVRELLLKSRVCRSVLNVNQKNINFGRITTFSKSSKKVLIHNGSAIPLIYMVEKTGSISSGFVEIKDGAHGVIKPFGTRQVHFEFQPTLAGPFEEKLKIVNVQDVDNSVYITIKAKVVKRETFKLPQAGQPINVGTCLVGEKSEVFKVTIRNMSRKKREYVIEVDLAAGFSAPSLRPTFQFSMDDVPAANITQAQEKKLDEELEKLEHKLRIAVTKKKDDKIDKLNSKITHVKALLSGEEVAAPVAPKGLLAPAAGAASLSSYDSGNSDTESETESKYNARRNSRNKTMALHAAAATQPNILHFTLEPEATGRIVGEVIFQQVADLATPTTHAPKPNIRHRGQRRKGKAGASSALGAVPVFGHGKFLFYEQQNKDVMKELQYKADVFLRTPAGEAAYCRTTNKALLPPMPSSLKQKPCHHELSVELKGDQLGSTRGNMLLLPVDEAPCDTPGWNAHLRVREPMQVELRWVATDVIQDLIVFSVQVADQEGLQPHQASSPTLLPITLMLAPDSTVTVMFKWSFSAKSGQVSSAPLGQVLPLDVLSMNPNADVPAGQLVFSSTGSNGRAVVSSALDVAIVKSKPRSLHVDSDRIDLGELQLGTQTASHFYICNVSKHAIKFLILVSSEDPSQLAIDNPTGRIEAGGKTMIRFTYTGIVSGKRSEHILVRNLSDKLDFTTLSVVVRVTRPVYVRIPELDPHMTGQLLDLNIGPCYVTSGDEGENNSKFSKVRKLTLDSQVTETLLLSASSNLKTQCYVYQDAALQHEATNIILPGMESLDLFIAFRPRLPADSFKTGIARNLVGGIRIQLHRDKEDERTLAAEFTVKFVGVAGASLASVSSRLLDFGTETNVGRLTRCKVHEGKFDLVNLSKSLPLRYRLRVTQGDEYSDDDGSLRVALRHEKGDIPPGESSEIDFGVMAYTHGYFRRRIVVENVFNPMNVNMVDVVLFVDNGTVSIKTASGGGLVDFGDLPLVRADNLFGPPAPSTSLAEAHTTTRRRYRIYLHTPLTRTISVTNRSVAVLRLRPLSNLPLQFVWQGNSTDWQPFARTIDGHNARELNASALSTSDVVMPATSTDHANHHMLYFGDVGTCPPQSTTDLTVSFAPVASSPSLPLDVIEAGHNIPAHGFVALQSFQDQDECGTAEATTLGLVHVSGTFGESNLSVPTRTVLLGKLGYGQPKTFEVEVKNLSEMPGLFYVGALPPCFRLVDIREATARAFQPRPQHDAAWASSGSTCIPPLKQLAQRVCAPIAWELDGYDTATLEIECFPECLTAGKHELSFTIANVNNPHNVERVVTQLHVIAKYIDVSLEPSGVNPSKPMETCVGYFEPLVVPSTSSVGLLCTLVNVFDESVDIHLQCNTLADLEQLLDLEIVSRSSKTPVTSLTLAPAERVDVRITCRLVQASRVATLPFSTMKGSDGGASTTNRFDDAVPLGVVLIRACCSDVVLSCSERIEVYGSFVLGQTFTVSTASLSFQASAVHHEMSRVYRVHSDDKSAFTIYNPSTKAPLVFSIESTPKRFSTSRFLLAKDSPDIITDVLVGKCTPDHGCLPPGESLQVTVELESAPPALSSTKSGDVKIMQVIVRDNDQSHATIDLVVNLDDTQPLESDAPRFGAVAINSTASSMPSAHKRRPSGLVLSSTSSAVGDLMSSMAPPSSGLSKPSAAKCSPAVLPSEASFECTTDDEEASPDPSSVATSPSYDKKASDLITLRGCTPAENSTLDNALYVIDVGQHTVRSGGDVEWEISLHVEREVEYRLYLADSNAKAWLHLSRTHGTVVNFQTIVLRFVRDVVGVFSTFVVLENCTNPTDLKLIRVKLEVIADLNALRAMSKDKAADNLFRVLVSCYSSSKRQRRKSSEDLLGGDNASGKLEIEYGDVFYDKLYHNHSLVLENFSSLSLDFMLSSNGRAHEVGFSMSPNSFNEISSVTLAAYARLQVFLNFRPAPRTQTPEAPSISWVRNIEVYINCRLVKDFRETVFLKAICNYPQVNLHIARTQPTVGHAASYHEPAAPYFPSQPTFLGMGFMAPESVLVGDGCAIEPKFLVMKNARQHANAHVAIRNDSMFFEVVVHHIFRAATGAPDPGHHHASTGMVKLEPSDIAVFKIRPNLELLRKNRQQWEHSVKEHIAFYNMKQFAEHYHVSLSFTPSNTSSFYVAPQLREAYPFSTLEDTIAKFLRQYSGFWKWLATALTAQHASSMLFDLENAIDHVLPVSPRHHPTTHENLTFHDNFAHAYRALYFDFYYITDELIWYGIRSSAGRHAITLADLVYGVVFGHEVFGAIFNRLRVDVVAPTTVAFANQRLDMRRLLLPWTRQLGYFLSFFPETQEATLALRQMYEPLKHFDIHR